MLKRVPLKADCFAPGASAPSVQVARGRTSFCRALCLTVLLIIVGRPVESSAQPQDVVDRQPDSAAASSAGDRGSPDSGATAADKVAAHGPAMSDKTTPDKAGSDKSILDLDIDQLGKVPAKVPTAFDTEVTTVTANKSSVG